MLFVPCSRVGHIYRLEGWQGNPPPIYVGSSPTLKVSPWLKGEKAKGPPFTHHVDGARTGSVFYAVMLVPACPSITLSRGT